MKIVITAGAAVSLLILAATVRSQSAPEPLTPPRLSVRFEILLTPDADAAALGVKPRKSFVYIDNGYWSDASTSAGCLVGPFRSSRVAMRATQDGFELETVNPADDPTDTESCARWVAKLKDNALSGELWETMKGAPLSAEELRAEGEKVLARIRAERTIRIDGKVANQPEVDALSQHAMDEHLKLQGRGRTLHYTFTTTKISLTPSGTWLKFPPTDSPATSVDQKPAKS